MPNWNNGLEQRATELVGAFIQQNMPMPSGTASLNLDEYRGIMVLLLSNHTNRIQRLIASTRWYPTFRMDNDDSSLKVIGDQLSEYLSAELGSYLTELRSLFGLNVTLLTSVSVARHLIETVLASPIDFIHHLHTAGRRLNDRAEASATTMTASAGEGAEVLFDDSSTSPAGRVRAGWLERNPAPRPTRPRINPVRHNNGVVISDELRSRNRDEAQNLLYRNMNTAYAHCFGKYKGKYVYVHSFEGETKVSARCYEVTENGLADQYKNYLYVQDSKDFEFDLPELGWYQCGKGHLWHVSILPGGDGRFLKTVSRRNTMVDLVLYTNGEARNEVHIEQSLSSIKWLFEPVRIGLNDGLSKKLDSFVLNRNVAIYRAKGATDLRHVFFNTTKVGTLSEKYRYIKLNKRYLPIMPYLSKAVDNYEIR